MAEDKEHFGSFFVPEYGEISEVDLIEMPDEYKEDFVRDWFFYMYEDPASQTPYESAEGGYQYIWGGPFEAREEIEAKFSGIVSDDIIEAVVDSVERHSDVWAPTEVNPQHNAFEERSHTDLMEFEKEFEGDPGAIEEDASIFELNPQQPENASSFFDFNQPFGQPNRPPFGERDLIADHEQIDARLERGARSSFGSSYDRAVRQTFQKHAADLRALLEQPPAPQAKHGGIGHNQPPSDIQLEEESKEELKAAVETISEELKLERPDVRKVSRVARVIQSIGLWAARKLDMTLDVILKTLAAGLTGQALINLDATIQKSLEIYQLIIEWLNAVVQPF
ncbi:hypothetical protein [Thalassospira xiamenensis]|uniref:Uncharacterized protein n=1 Tax=Thalassospira xiamenensis TaxID=220697 RepID=A0ABR5XXT3_9PROT|nr:hypothetical protein [Thalassospira xiamenensis]KZD00869.1 hypothetical protein AUP40_21345 [Thalassospira xiamenensis]KZD04135.1 hypothetical protein AUP45_21680 [Thalassospira xiamenensis]